MTANLKGKNNDEHSYSQENGYLQRQQVDLSSPQPQQHQYFDSIFNQKEQEHSFLSHSLSFKTHPPQKASTSGIFQEHLYQFPLPPSSIETPPPIKHHRITPNSEWNESASSFRSSTSHSLYERSQRPLPSADVPMFNNLRDDIDNSDRYLRCAPSSESLLALLELKRTKTPRGVTATTSAASTHSGLQTPQPNLPEQDLSSETLVNGRYVPYPAWTTTSQSLHLPSYQEIQETFVSLKNVFGFQYDSMLNMLDHFMVMLDSRASRMAPTMALLSLHADYIGGPNANYRKWYFAAQLDLDNAVGDKHAAKNVADSDSSDSKTQQQITLTEAEQTWQKSMEHMSDIERVRQLALWLMIWGEASVIRFCPEALCFIFKLANDAAETKLETAAVSQSSDFMAAEGDFLDKVISPLYDFVKCQVYRKDKQQDFVRRDRDHANVIGYDDVNQLFWYPETIDRLQLQDKTKLMSIDPPLRFNSLKDVHWEKAFQKTFKEKRSWMHLAVNFSRIWIIHIVSFWYYIAANADILYLSSDKETAENETSVKISMAALGGAVATLLVMLGSFVEYVYVPMNFQRAGILSRRLALLFLVLILNIGPSVYCLVIKRTGTISMVVSLVQLLISLITSVFFALMPQSRLFIKKSRTISDQKKTPASQTFTASFPHLKKEDRLISIGLWACVFGCKLLESYFFLALSFKDPLKAIASMEVSNCHDAILGSFLCSYMPSIMLALMLVMELVLFFLDTYLWYVIWNTVFSVARSFYLGISIWSPWRNVFLRLPKRIYVKILAASEFDFHIEPKMLCSQIWNAVVVSMYREHLLSADHVSKLLYRQIAGTEITKPTLKPPTFFVSQEDVAFETEYYPQKSEAERRMQFFAQSLTTPMPESLPVPNMPTFTVMTPHYGEKIILSLREIIREEEKNARITLLEYLKQLHPFEWENFVKDTKIFADETSDMLAEEDRSTSTRKKLFESATPIDEKTEEQHKIDDLPFYCVGFKSSSPEYTLRTRIWASLRTQTLFRTISGFMNYHKAIKLLYRVETPELRSSLNGIDESGDTASLVDSITEPELEQMASRKFRFLVAMQRYSQFNLEEKENVNYILKAYPDLQIAYLEQETEEDVPVFYTVLIDGHCTIRSDGTRSPKYRIRLPGNPILGDGKADNQNTALIYYRGEYLQLIDANQDNYLEECIKIRNVLSEFEEIHPTNDSPYADYKTGKTPVAIVGAREYIFSENVGVLGDVAAGKEQTFGTLTQRIMATIGGRLHYGHPDFLNAIYMTTRGGVSKAQKGLHLNEDIYAGMNAFGRGGRIKHVEYFQCGKGRDLGFGSVLNFVTKIGSGMGEQMLSREYYYLGTQLPLDRFLTFFYAHPGFHVNNIFIMMSVHMFMLVLLFVAATSMPLTVCEVDAAGIALRSEGCYNLVPIFEWLGRVVISIFAIIFVSFLPLFLQELTERGFFRACSRLCKHMLSLSPLFEIFVTQTYANSILNNLTFGGARYIGTGRGFATARLPFSLLYSRFADTSMYVGARLFLILFFGSLVLWIPHLAYFWFTVMALILSPFLFNPHQFALTDFLMDYREYIRWLSRGNGSTHHQSWIEYCRFVRMRTTGVKKKQLDPKQPTQQQSRARFSVVLFSEILLPFLLAVLSIVAYVFIESFDASKRPSALLRVGAFALGPILLNAGILMVLFMVSLLGGCVAGVCCGVKFGATIAAIAHGWSVFNFILFFEAFYLLENWELKRVILGMIAVGSVQRFVFKLMTVLLLTREFYDGQSNQGWWTGRWYGRGFGWYALTQPMREFVCKTIEMSLFATDFIMGHFILFPLFLICLIPGIDKWHSLMLFWLKPSEQIQEPIYSVAQRSRRRRIAVCYGISLVILFIAFIGLLVAPAMLGPHLSFKLSLPI